MRNVMVLCGMVLFFMMNHGQVFAQYVDLNKDNISIIGRGSVEWNEEELTIDECFIALKQEHPTDFTCSISLKGTSSEEGVQAWLGFGFQDRDQRYALGLRGGNNNDLYLCRYQPKAQNKMLALESLDFDIKPEVWYDLQIRFFKGNIQVFINGEKQPRIFIKDEKPLLGGAIVLGGGWIPTTYRDLTINPIADEIPSLLKLQKYQRQLSPEQKESKRQELWANYKPISISALEKTRTEISMNGNWLFMPGYQLESQDFKYVSNIENQDWHIMPVPSFWNPVRNWLHLQEAHLPHRGSGISDNYREKEEGRCEAYTFDYLQTTSAWYRHHIEIADELLKGKKYRIQFDAVSKIADLFVNGKYVGGHIGMFGSFEFDITPFLHKGMNELMLEVKVRKESKSLDAEEKVTQAVSVDITNDMLNSLPHGMFNGDEGGIWQGVKLVITQACYIDDVFARGDSTTGNFEVSIRNISEQNETIDLLIEVLDQENGERLFVANKNDVLLHADQYTVIELDTASIQPKLWSPENPSMYLAISSLYKNGILIDKIYTPFGFRSFQVKGNKFVLNGSSYYLRGANHPPCGIAPNDSALAHTFFKLMHDGHQMITRSHACPFTEEWMNAADIQGVGVSYEGSWPWLMIDEIPSLELLEIWKEEMISLVKKYRNHPSLLIWTINNEMYFTMFHKNDDPQLRLKKWEILSDLIKEIRKLSPNTAISSDSGYGRLMADYDKYLKPHDIDDGDIDDRHVYFNWYNRDFFQVIDGEWAERIYWSPGANADRPFFSQETSTGYTNNDIGHYNRKYLFNNYVPQAWVGDWAYEDRDPSYTLQRHAFMTKELMEVIRRTSPETAGVLLFSNVTWFKNVFEADRIEPYPIYEAVKTASQDILVSAELFGRNFFAGAVLQPRLCIVNNAANGKDLPASQIQWEIVHDGQVLSKDIIAVEGLSHYERLWLDAEINLPEHLPSSKSKCQLVLKLLSGDQMLSANEYDLLITEKDWIFNPKDQNRKKISVFDLTGETMNTLDRFGVDYRIMKDLTEIRTQEADLLIIANLDMEDEIPYNWEDVKKVCANGTSVLLIHPGKHLQWLYYNKIASIYERKGRVVNMHIPEHPAFNGIDPMELVWWQQEGREKPRACRRSFRLKTKEDIQALSTYLRPHTDLGSNPPTYLDEMSGIPLMEIKEGKGRLIASEMETNMGYKDPIAAKILFNIIEDLLKE